jgi:uncharacterized membrane protein (Fun14 family)
MINEALIPTTTAIGGGFLIGILLGYFVKKVFKILMFVAGGVLGLLLYLQQQEIISINYERIETLSALLITDLSSSFDRINLIGDMSFLGIPLTASMTAGFTLSLVKG